MRWPPAADYLVHDASAASAASVIVAVLSGMTVGDGPVSERRGSRLVSTARLLGTPFLAGTALTLYMGGRR